MTRRHLLTTCHTAFLLLIMLPGAVAFADASIWSADKAARALQNNEIILLDIRSPQEWQETGLAEGAWPVSLHEPGFGEKIGAIIRANENRTIALICAVGGRSASVLSHLKGLGVSNFVDVSEGMLGSKAGPGWIKRDLAIVPLKKAQETLDSAMPALQ